uniref:NADH-ubiquinone oxidoreductase chain 2 n=1 Tax=Petrobiellus sp. 2 JZ-2014 TaxID=1529459 RepID=A0A0B4N5M6_9INSE|nr:NADH dehydrogenase subunit 2 [Petrobiellus sp. 2 JZ-2014]
MDQMTPTKTLFILTLISGTLMSVSASSWFGVWMGLEINLLSFIPIMSSKKNQRSAEAMLNYFLIQAFGSIILLLSAISLSLNTSMMYSNELSNLFLMMMTSSILLKMGAAPFQFWFPKVMEGLEWITSIILMTIQKLGPLTLLFYNMMSTKHMIMMSTLLSALIGALGGLNQTSLRKILAYSSINHLSWMMISMPISDNLWFSYFMLYVLLSTSVALIFLTMQMFHMNQIQDLLKNSNINKMMISVNLLSLGGLPPFLGFLPKWMVIQNIDQNNMMLMLFLVTMSLITLFYYLRIMFISMTLSAESKKWASPKKIKNNILIIFTVLSLMLLPASPFIIWMM